MTFCSKCWHKNDENTKFCINCWNNLTWTQTKNNSSQNEFVKKFKDYLSELTKYQRNIFYISLFIIIVTWFTFYKYFWWLNHIEIESVKNILDFFYSIRNTIIFLFVLILVLQFVSVKTKYLPKGVLALSTLFLVTISPLAATFWVVSSTASKWYKYFQNNSYSFDYSVINLDWSAKEIFDSLSWKELDKVTIPNIIEEDEKLSYILKSKSKGENIWLQALTSMFFTFIPILLYISLVSLSIKDIRYIKENLN